MAKYQVTNKGNGFTGDNMTNYINPRGKERSNQLSFDNERPNSIDIGVILAKDHEFSSFEKEIKKYRFEIMDFPIPNELKGEFLIKTFKKGNLQIAYSFVNCMGWQNIEKFVPKFIGAVQPKALTTIGICGGEKTDIGKVWFFCGTKYEEKGEIQTKQFITNDQVLPISMWRANSPDWFNRPKLDTFVFSTRDDHPSENFTNILHNNTCVGIDMEIGGIVAAVETWNRYSDHKCVILPMIKGVSDTGPKIERDQNAPKACENATLAFLNLVEYFNDKKTLLSFT